MRLEDRPMPNEMRDELTRRSFLGHSAVGAAAGAAAGAILSPSALANPADQRLRIGFIGPGRRGFGSHVKTLTLLRKQGRPVDLTAVCDVYRVHRERAVEYIHKETGAKPQAFVDYRDMLAGGNLVDAVCIATPDHWHARQVLDALAAGKHVFCEKPMTHTLEESLAVVSAWKESGRVMQVGVQSTSMPIWNEVREMLNDGRIGKVVQFQTESSRNSLFGMSRHNEITPEMTPQNIDWERWLGVKEGLAPDLPFDRATFGQWRCYWPFGYGMYSDLFVHRVTTMLLATGLRFPGRVVGGGGIFLEFDDREVPDVATVVADFYEGVQGLVSSTMVSEKTTIQHVIRGHHGSLVFDPEIFGKRQAVEFIPERPQVTLDSSLKPHTIESQQVPNQDLAHFANFLDAIEANDPARVNNPPDLGAAAVAMVTLAVRSYREGKVFHCDPSTGAVRNGDASWANHWEQLSKQQAKPPHIPGWHAGDKGSTLRPPEYQKLAGPWVNGRPPR
jgi:predicted dehydrogenase